MPSADHACLEDIELPRSHHAGKMAILHRSVLEPMRGMISFSHRKRPILAKEPAGGWMHFLKGSKTAGSTVFSIFAMTGSTPFVAATFVGML